MEAISKQGIIGPHWFEDENERLKWWIRNVMWQIWGSSGHQSNKADGLIVINSGSSRTGKPPHIKSHPWLAERAISKKGWSAGSV